MPLWKIIDNSPSKIKETKFKQKKLDEGHMEEWIAADPSILEKPLLVFGRQVRTIKNYYQLGVSKDVI
jgi:hypothetical protein